MSKIYSLILLVLVFSVLPTEGKSVDIATSTFAGNIILNNGKAAIVDSRIKLTSKIFVQLTKPGGTLGADHAISIQKGKAIISSVGISGNMQPLDNSALDYLIIY